MMSRSNFIGIDLGTTFSAIAHINEHGMPEVIENAEGERTTPSIVLFDGNEIAVGAYAKENIVAYPGQVVEFVKRNMGDKLFSFEYRGRHYGAAEVSSFILRKLKNDAEEKLGERISDVVITVPAYFGDPQRRATMEAGELAGLKVSQLINEPTAAAYAYGLHKLGANQRVLVFDLGGGTFDVTVMEISGDLIEVKATNGDHQLGGRDWDEALVQYIADKFERKYGFNTFDDEADYQALKEKALSAKISLSSLPKVNMIYGCKGKTLKEEITRQKFEEITSRLVEQCWMLTEMVLDEARIKTSSIDVVLLAGGSTRMPMVSAMLSKHFGKEPSKALNPDECVAMGAAVKAAMLQKKSWALPGQKKTWALPSKIADINVTSHSFGLAVLKDEQLFNSIIIPKNTPYPVDKSKDDYVTTYDNQETLDLYVLEGESEDPRDCELVGSYQIYDIPKRGAGKTKLKVTYKYNQNQIVEASAVDLNNNKTLAMKKITEDVDLNRLLIDKKVDVSLYSEFAGQTRIKGALSDKYGNAAGTQYDLGRDGAFGDFHVHILYLYLESGLAFKLPQDALCEKGFGVSITNNIEETLLHLKSRKLDILWIISGGTGHLSAPLLSSSQKQEIVKFYKSGGGLYIWADNAPFIDHANQILPDIVGAKLVGCTDGNKVLKEGDGITPGTFKPHLITTGIVNLYEGVTISYPYPIGQLIPLASSTDGNPVICYYDGKNSEGRLILDCGFTKLYVNWDTAGTARYVKNATVWLLNLEKTGALRK